MNMSEFSICLFSDTVYDINGVSKFLNDFSIISKEKNFCIITSTLKCSKFNMASNIINLKVLFKIKMPFYKELDLTFPQISCIKNEILKLSPNLIHISTPGPIGIVASYYSNKFQIPKAGIYHTDFPNYIYKNTNSKILKMLCISYLKWFYKDFKLLFVRSNEYKNILVKELGFDENKIVYLKAGIDISKYSKDYRDINIWNKYNLNNNHFKLLYVGRVSKEKNISNLIEIFKLINKKDKNIDLVLVGSGEYLEKQNDYKKYNIFFLGQIFGEELSKIYASSDTFVFPSTTDTLGQVVLEALSSGLPCIVTDKGGPKEFVNEANAGFSLDLDDIHKWIKTIELLKKDLILREELSNNATKFMQNMDIKKSFEDFWQKNNSCVYPL